MCAPPSQPKQEGSPLLSGAAHFPATLAPPSSTPCRSAAVVALAGLVALVGAPCVLRRTRVATGHLVPTGPYRLAEAQEGRTFYDFYDFYAGPDSLGSAGYNQYVAHSKATALDIAHVVRERDARTGEEGDFAYMSSAATAEGPRASVRLEGKTRFDRGLFILDVRHTPDGCGVWPAFWLTDEAAWPRNGEVDILEGVNGQTTAKTALHTSERCDMYAHVPAWARSGDWEWITGIPDTFTGAPDLRTGKPADDCWVMAPHQWANEGCTAVHDHDDTLGKPVNDYGGGVYALEWDPENKYIKSWVFSPELPSNLRDALDTAGREEAEERVVPDPATWGLPYAYFAIGEGTGCSADHFKRMRLVFNLAFCGNVAGNRFSRECPALAQEFNVTHPDTGAHDPVLTCNAYIDSNPEALEEAYWKIKGVYVYEREYEKKHSEEPLREEEES